MQWNNFVKAIHNSSNNVILNEKKLSIFKLARIQTVYNFDVLNEFIHHVDRMKVNGYLHIYGSNIEAINKVVKEFYPGNKIVVATDIFGGIFAISNGDFEGEKVCIWYYAPDTLQWENLNIDYEHFLQWVLCDDFEQFYISFCWDGIENTLNTIGENQAVLIYPYLWSEECDINTATKKLISFSELVKINAEYEKQMSV